MNREEIQQLFQKFNGLTVLIVGDVMIDAYYWGKVERISPEAPVPVVQVNKKENRLGGAANVALNVKSLGAKAIICSVVGDGSKGDIFRTTLKENHFTTEGIIDSPETNDHRENACDQSGSSSSSCGRRNHNTAVRNG
jgi:rfaE bifunctional protein kinase chain/domain